MPASVTEAAAALLKALAGFDPALLSGAECASTAERLAVVEKACAGARARAAARAVDCGAHRQRAFAEGADWLAHATGSSRGEAKAALGTGEALRRVPEAEAAVREGLLSLDQAAEVLRTEATVPGSAPKLLAFAARRGLQALREEGRRLRLAAVDPEELHRRQVAARSFRHWRDAGGMVCFRGALPPDSGVPFVNRVDAECDRIRRGARREGRAEPREAHAADALLALLEGKGRGRSKAADLVVVCDLRAWRRGRARPGEPCHVLGGGPIPIEVARELSRDAFLKAVLHDGVDVKLVRHFGRHIPAELRTALDLGSAPAFEGIECADGCGRRYGLEWDHVNPVANGGPTSFDNLRPRCWGCHHDKTERDRAGGLLMGRGSTGGGGTTDGRAPP